VKFPEQYEVDHPKRGMRGLRAFFIPYNKKIQLKVIAAIEPNGWEHVSVSLPGRPPFWDEMHFIKDMFFDGEDVVYQLHPKKSEYVNLHPNCLHLWKPPVEIQKLIEDR